MKTETNSSSREIELLSVRVAKVTEEVVPPEMPEELVLVDEARVAKLAERMAAVRGIVRIALAPVSGQSTATVRTSLVTKDLKVNAAFARGT